MAHIYYGIYRVYILHCIDTHGAVAAEPLLFFPDPQPQDQGVIKALQLDQRLDHRILIWKRHYCRRFCLCFRRYLRHHLRHCGLSLYRMFCCRRDQAWIVKCLLTVCDKMLF